MLDDHSQARSALDDDVEITFEYERLLPLEGGNNFRDMGGYSARGGKKVKRGQIFRSGVMTGLTAADQDVLSRLNIATVVDFRSREELDLFPNHWARERGLNFINHDYSLTEISSRMFDESGKKVGVHILYQNFPILLKPQLSLLFHHLMKGNAPLVFNCSAGQDRTGIAAALILRTLGVARETILEDYHLSTRFRRPEIETAGVDFSTHAGSNAFADMMLRYGEGSKTPKPLYTSDKVPYLHFAFAQMEKNYGSIDAYLATEIGVDKDAVELLRATYLS
ncbi:MAG: tyrosine-protein phosphatase [Porticoccaceae bacterium]